MTQHDPDALTIAVRVADPVLAGRINVLLGQVPGIILADADEPADLVLAPSEVDGRRQTAPLTPRERDVIALLAEGLSNKAIAVRLGISVDTAKFHVGRLIDKLDATGRTDAVAHAARCGIIQL
jgi:DNA-binding CsgD family transcriptional regulator